MRRRQMPPPLRGIAESESRRLYYRLRRERYADIGARSALAEAPTDHAVSRVLAEREQQIAKLATDNASLRDLALRARAELDNARKRMRREKAETIKFANENLARELIVVVDNLERALASANDTPEAKAVHDGIEMVLQQFLGVLRANGLELIASDGEIFNPHFHEAVSAEEREDVEDNRIIDTLQKGYTLRGRVVRPAMVRVARAVTRAVPAGEAASVAADMDAEETLADLDDAVPAQVADSDEQVSVQSVPSPDEQSPPETVDDEEESAEPLSEEDEVESPGEEKGESTDQPTAEEDRPS